MKILHVISSGGMYGAEAVILNLSQALHSQKEQSEVALFENLPHPNYDLESPAAARSIKTHRIACQGQIDLSVPGRIRDLTRYTQADIVHAHGYKADLYTWAALRNSGIPLVSTCHTWYDNSVLLRAYGALDRRVLRSFAAVVAVSKEVEARLLAAGVVRERVVMIRNGIGSEVFAGRTAHPASVVENALTVGLVGRLSYEKGVDLFVQAAARVLQDFPETRFQIIGEGPDRATLEDLIHTLNLVDGVRLLGRKNDMPAVYASINIIVSSSRQEGLPISLLEAMASGCAIVATAVGEVPSLILDQKTGLLVPPENVDALAAGIKTLLRSTSLRKQLGTAAQHRLNADFSARQMADQYRHIYSSVLTTSSRTRA